MHRDAGRTEHTMACKGLVVARTPTSSPAARVQSPFRPPKCGQIMSRTLSKNLTPRSLERGRDRCNVVYDRHLPLRLAPRWTATSTSSLGHTPSRPPTPPDYLPARPCSSLLARTETRTRANRLEARQVVVRPQGTGARSSRPPDLRSNLGFVVHATGYPSLRKSRTRGTVVRSSS